ncbi:MAG TPA: glycosyltransferase family 39 protein [Bacteroidia bacterium]|jgi:4-amino-4-deoxy-L-arabinose transferase
MADLLFNNRLFVFSIGLVLIAGSIILHVIKKEKLSVILLAAASFFLFLYATVLCPFLNLWDERFHALVAKNLMRHPLMPTLYDDPVVNMAYDRWDRFHIWVHKQPLFLWEIMISYKIFGVNEFALRLPSAISAALLVAAAYRSGKILRNHTAGYFTALLIATSFCIMELVDGRRGLDHNDLSFMCWISFSIWAWLEYRSSGKKWWIPVIGSLSGFAILCKWLAGLLVYLVWGACALQENKFRFKKYSDIALALLVTITIALPWQLLIFHWYPAEAKISYDYNLKHFLTPLDGHSGPWTYHFEMISGIYGTWAPWLILQALFAFYWRCRDKKTAIALLSAAAFVYAFFTITATKMSSFTTVAALPVFLSFGFLMELFSSTWEKLRLRPFTARAALALALLAFAYSRIDLSAFEKFHGASPPQDPCAGTLEKNRNLFKQLHLPANTVLFNVPGRHYVEAMFYSDVTAYNFIPSEEQYLALKNKHRGIAILKHPNEELPAYLTQDASVILLDIPIQQCE